MTEEEASISRVKRKQRTSFGAPDPLKIEDDPIPLLTPSKRYSTGSHSRGKSSSASATSPINVDTPSPSSPLVIARNPSENSKIWAARIAATQRLAQRRRGSGVGTTSSRTSAAMAKRRALSLSPAAATFEASVSITTALVEKKKKVTTPTKTLTKRRRESTSSLHNIDEESQENVIDDKDTIKGEDKTPEEPKRVRKGRSKKLETVDEAQESEHDETLECKVEIKSEPEVVVKGRRRSTRAAARVERPPLVPSPRRRRTLFVTTETELELDVSHDQQEEEQTAQPEETSDVTDVDTLKAQLSTLAATLVAEQAEKAALKEQVEALTQQLLESQQEKQQLEAKLASIVSSQVVIKQEHA